MEVKATRTDSASLSNYAKLFESCFPNAEHLGEKYLQWLYCENPAGTVIGCDAWDGDQLAAHYVCIPVDAMIGGNSCKVMLSLNTATHPEFQGRGLFTRLAEATYALGEEAGVSAVYGVANANSTPGFVRKLGFSLIRPLDAWVGLGRLSHGDEASVEADFCRDWNESALRWRVRNPERPYRLVQLGRGVIGTEASTGKFGINAWDELRLPPGMDVPSNTPSLSLRLHLGLRPGKQGKPGGCWIDVPHRLRPSPLNFIFRPLAANTVMPSANSVRLGQLDFDAF